jgi:hypothetical protein
MKFITGYEKWDGDYDQCKVVSRFKGCETNMGKYNKAFDKLMKALSAE